MVEHVPTGLRHVLEVVRLVRRSAMNRRDAVKHIAKAHRVDHQSVMSACTRSLGINAEELDDLLPRDAAAAFCEHLVRRFPQYQTYIEEFFGNLAGQLQVPAEDVTGRLRALFPDEQRQLLNVLLVRETEEFLSRWFARRDLPAEMRNEVRGLQEMFKTGSP